VYEVAREHLVGVDEDRLLGDVREAIAAHHGLELRGLALVKPGAVPRTSSGKVRRSACRSLYLEGRLARVR
jgi:acyl-CoA synthetase (AMP-forming)/AMP-acid ligase II